MLQQEAHISTFCCRVPITIYSPEINTAQRKSLLVPGQLSLQAGLNHTIPLDGNNRSFTKVSNTHYKIPVMPTYDCKYDQIVTTKYYNIHVQTYHSPLIGAASIIKQHLRKTPCSVAIDTTLHIGSCIPHCHHKAGQVHLLPPLSWSITLPE